MKKIIPLPLFAILLFIPLFGFAQEEQISSSLTSNISSSGRYGKILFSKHFGISSPVVQSLGNQLDSVFLYRDIAGLTLLANNMLILEKSTKKTLPEVSSLNLYRKGLEWVQARPVDQLDTLELAMMINLGYSLETSEGIRILNNTLYDVKQSQRIRSRTSRGASYTLELQNNTNQVLYIYLDGVFQEKIYQNKTAAIPCEGGCRKFEVENLDGEMAEKQICFTSIQKVNWKINKQ